MKENSVLAVVTLFLISTNISFASTMTLYTPTAGDASYAYNGRSGPYGYTTGATEMGVYLSIGYGNDYTVSIFEVPIAALAGKTVTSATLQVESLGFGTGYYYGNANIGWLDTGSMTLTGDVVADNLGPASTGRPNHFNIGLPGAGLLTFDVLSFVQADLDAGRTYSTFVLSGSRETYGSIRTAESGSGPKIVATVVPEPMTMALLGLGGLLLRRRK